MMLIIAAQLANKLIGNGTDAFWPCLEYTTVALSAQFENGLYVLIKPFAFAFEFSLGFRSRSNGSSENK